MLGRENLLYQRTEKGDLIPQEVELELLPDKPTVKLIPLTRGKLQEIYTKSVSSDVKEKLASDCELIKFGLVEPKLSDADIEYLKPKYAGAITTAILAISLDIPQMEITDKTSELIKEQEVALGKKK